MLGCILTTKRKNKYNKLSKTNNNGITDKGITIISTFSELDYWGLTDRFKGMVSLYDYCLKHNYRYKILHKKPFRLTEFVVPNKIDWTFDEEFEYSDDSLFHLYLSGDYGVNEKIIWDAQKWILDCVCKNRKLKYLFVHTNAAFGLPNFAEYHKLLFKPTKFVDDKINEIQKKLGQSYFSVSFRFVNLLGDSEEMVSNIKIAEEKEKHRLINESLSILNNIIEENPKTKILVTSDSYVFLSHLEQLSLPDVHFLVGDKIHHHMGFTTNSSSEIFLKPFVEFYLISQAERVYQIKIGLMYHSQFPVKAALLENKSYILIEKQ